MILFFIIATLSLNPAQPHISDDVIITNSSLYQIFSDGYMIFLISVSCEENTYDITTETLPIPPSPAQSAQHIRDVLCHQSYWQQLSYFIVVALWLFCVIGFGYYSYTRWRISKRKWKLSSSVEQNHEKNLP